MRPRILVGQLVGSTNKLQLIKAKRLDIKVYYTKKLFGNKIVKTIIK